MPRHDGNTRRPRRKKNRGHRMHKRTRLARHNARTGTGRGTRSWGKPMTALGGRSLDGPEEHVQGEAAVQQGRQGWPVRHPRQQGQVTGAESDSGAGSATSRQAAAT